MGQAAKNYHDRFPDNTFHNFWGQSWKMLKIELPEGTFDHICQAAKMLKINCRRPLLTTSGARQRKCSKSTTGGHIGPYLETCYQVLEK